MQKIWFIDQKLTKFDVLHFDFGEYIIADPKNGGHFGYPVVVKITRTELTGIIVQ